jgi:hypothetical protein
VKMKGPLDGEGAQYVVGGAQRLVQNPMRREGRFPTE